MCVCLCAWCILGTILRYRPLNRVHIEFGDVPGNFLLKKRYSVVFFVSMSIKICYLESIRENPRFAGLSVLDVTSSLTRCLHGRNAEHTAPRFLFYIRVACVFSGNFPSYWSPNMVCPLLQIIILKIKMREKKWNDTMGPCPLINISER